MPNTCGAAGKKADQERARYAQMQSNPEWKAKRLEQMKAARHRKRLASQIAEDEQIALQEKVKRLEKSLFRKEKEIEELRFALDQAKRRALQQSASEEMARPPPPPTPLLVASPSVPLCETRLEDLCRDPVRFKECSGVTLDEFLELAMAVEPEWANLTSKGEPRRNDWSVDPAISFRAQLLITLIWLRISPPLSLLSWAVSLHRRSLAHFINRTTNALYSALVEKEIRWPTEPEWQEQLQRWDPQLPAHIKHCVSVIDGTEICVPRPSDRTQERRHYSPKKKQHMVNFPIVCLLDGKIIFVGKGESCPNDQGIWNRTGLRERYERKPYGILADGGYTLNRKSDTIKIFGVTPHKKKRKQRLTALQKEENQKLSQYRVVVENAIGAMKRWRILSTKYSYYSTAKKGMVDINIVVKVVAALTNRKIRIKPLRDCRWRPRP
jgi:hypothetical protein